MTDKVIQYYEHYYDRSRDLEALATYVASHYTHNMPIIIGTLCCMLFVCSYVLHDIITESKEVESDEKELPLPVAKPRQSLFREFSFDSHKEYDNLEVDPLTTLDELKEMEEARKLAKELRLEELRVAEELRAQHERNKTDNTFLVSSAVLDPVLSFKRPFWTEAREVSEPSSRDPYWDQISDGMQWPEPQITLLEALA
ncbi:hypothetical protein CJU90_4315 [Yarrowia sp. C11]|nr:hypothetical protein CKK34_6598 [Yarrowia sp. E02]KAG5365250.1 hypothetical protein CJU90_4315 [Yarrowia sp. C11]